MGHKEVKLVQTSFLSYFNQCQCHLLSGIECSDSHTDQEVFQVPLEQSGSNTTAQTPQMPQMCQPRE